ncbi:MAG: translocation/assembly module TamB domain-containing protein [Acidobacteriota bacterium]|nr:translocation/assembly module TamB domain-containing protein [Acidobacteriota bacterium]
MRRRTLIIGASIVFAFLVVLTIVVHLSFVQRSIWNRIAAAIEESSGWQIEIHDVALRVLPARLQTNGITVAYEGRTVARLDRIGAKWGWRRFLRSPYRIESLTLEGVSVDFDAFPESSTDNQEGGFSFLEEFEIGELRVLGVGAGESIAGIEVAVDGLNIDGRLESGLATARVSAGRLSLERDGRLLDLGSVEIEGRGSQDGLWVERLAFGSAPADLLVTGEIGFTPALDGRFQVRSVVDLESAAHWWDPNLVTGLEPAGRLELEGYVAMTEASGLVLRLEHRGQPIRIAGYDLEVLDLAFENGQPSVQMAHPGWGRATATMTGPGIADLSATLDKAPVDRVLAFAAPRIAPIVGKPATLSGEIDGTISYPMSLEFLSGSVELELRSPLGWFVVRADGAGDVWRVTELDAQSMGASLRASGTLNEDGGIAADGLLAAADPRRVAESVERWLPSVAGLEVDGGPIEVRARVGGVLSAPTLSVAFDWTNPVIGGQRVEGISAEASGSFNDLDWKTNVSLSPGSSLTATGTARPLEGTAEGDWEVRAEALEELIALVEVPSDIGIQGKVEASGHFAASGSDVRVEGEISASNLVASEWSIGNLRADFAANPEEVVLRSFEANAYGGVVEGRLTSSLADLSAPATADLRWRDIQLGSLPVEIPEASVGLVSGSLHVEGSLARPEGDLEIKWIPTGTEPLVGTVDLIAGLRGGLLKVASERIDTAGGPAMVEITVPLGDLSLPDWLWPEAPGGPLRATAEVSGFQSRPLMEVLGQEDIQANVETDLFAEIEWDPLDSERPRVLVEARNLRVLHPSGNLVAEGPLVISLADDRFQLKPVVLVGLGSRIEASAAYDPAAHVVDGRLRARLAPEVAGMLPTPLVIEGPITVNADFLVPAERNISLMAVQGVLTIDHHDGRMIMRDPPVEIRDLRIVASLDDGAINIIDGSAEVNRGRVDMAGGWDLKSGQGVVLELDDVTTMVAGILTKWDGNIAVEPERDRLARVYGDLTLVAGLWDEHLDLASTVLADASTVTSEDDFLNDINLDLTIRGFAGIRVENNLGRFDVNWDQIRVSGTAAVPVLRGELKIAPGGVIGIAGQEFRVRRGTIEFTGNPDIDPVMEIVPESDTTLVGGEGQGFNATELATRGLAQGITGALGFENETLRPAEIAVQTESDPSVRFMVGQRLSRQLALFLATNLTDVQDRMTMLQYWNIPRFKGLAFQAYQETADENLGANVFQRFEWGGTSTVSDRPEIHSVRLDGEWPLSKRGLRRATRFRRSQPFDPFLLFVGAVRIERMLAEHGYQNARVTGEREGAPASPTLVFTCDPGLQQPVTFEGDSLPGAVRREVTALYQRQAMEGDAFDDMHSVVRRHVVIEGYTAPKITIERRGEAIVVDVQKGEKTVLQGPFFDGMPVDTVVPALRALATPGALAIAVDRPDWASRVVERILIGAGYLEAKVLGVSMVPVEAGEAEVRIAVEPGQRALVESVEILGDDPLGLTAATDLALRPGMPLDRTAIDAATRDLRNAYVKEGFRDASVRSSLERDEGGSWHAQVLLESGRRRIVREIRFVGRRDVSEKVLLKGVTLAPGDELTDVDLDRSASQIANFSPVERDTVRVVPVGATKADLEFGVTEKRRWTLEAGGGWSTERGFGAAFGARDDNLFGRGIGLNLRGSLDSVENKIFLLGSIPPVPGGRLSFITTVGYTTGDDPIQPDIFNQDVKLASLGASYRLPKNLLVGVYYRWTDTRTYEKIPDDFLPRDRKIQVGTLGIRAVVDRFDYLFDPRRGWGLTSDLGWSGAAIGSDLEFVSWLSGFSLALEPFHDATWMQAMRVGVAEPLQGTNLDPEARFFAGGQASIRGFDLNSVGPDFFGIPAGGGALFVLNEELRIPVWNPLRLAVFADIGQVWESWREADFNLSVGVGVGIRWSTPIGPLWADVAWPVANIGISSKKPKFYLGIGRPF